MVKILTKKVKNDEAMDYFDVITDSVFYIINISVAL